MPPSFLMPISWTLSVICFCTPWVGSFTPRSGPTDREQSGRRALETTGDPRGAQVFNILLGLSYDGSFPKGSCYNSKDPLQSHDRCHTVEGAVESAFETILGDGVQVQVTLLSRTDKGVRADGNYMAAILPNGTEFLGEDDRSASLCKLVNQCLKDRGHHAFVDLLQPLPEKYRFHWEDRRFLSQMSKSKSYEYFLVPECDFDSSGFGNSKGFLAWHVPWSFDVGAREAMQLAAGRLVGQHDFSAFTSQHGRDKESIRCLTSLQIDEVLAVPRESWPAQEVLRIRVTGESFLYRMVRYLVYALVLIGRGELMLRNLERVLVGSYRGWHRRRLHLKPAPSHGLRLAELQLDPDV